ncbi:hypothetical protein COOONC_07221 [Cooperia oncophora]
MLEDFPNRERLVELQEGLRRTFLDILAVTELRWKGTGSIDLEDSDYKFFHAGPEDTQGPSGTGFFVSRRLLPFVDAFSRENDRMSRLDVRFDANLYRFLAVYVPPSASSTAEDDEQYCAHVENIQAIILDSANKYTPCGVRPTSKMMHDTSKIHPIVLGDFNAHLGKKTNDMESSLGRHTYDSCRNTRGQILVDFCEELQLRAAATFFKTRNGRKWTWRSPNGKTFSCIDHIFACQIHSCTTRMRKRTRSKSYLDRDAYQMELARICPRTIQDPSNRYREICRYIRNAASVATRRTQARHYLSTDTLSLMRQQLKREMNTLTDRVAYIETCKLLRRMIRNDIRLHHRDLVQKAIATGGSLKMVQNQMSVGRRQPTQLRDKKGKLCVSRNEIKEVIREYYDQLYTSQSMVPYTQWKKDDDDCAPILPSEVETALKTQMPGKLQDTILTTEMLQWGAVNLIPLITELFNECLRTDNGKNNGNDLL